MRVVWAAPGRANATARAVAAISLENRIVLTSF
jgi:hypothetical protein